MTSSARKEVIGLIGMGLLGSALAENLGRAGYTVRGFDIAPDRMREHGARGGILAHSPSDAAHGASVVITCFMTAELVREVLLGPGGALESPSPALVVGQLPPRASPPRVRALLEAPSAHALLLGKGYGPCMEQAAGYTDVRRRATRARAGSAI